MIQFAAIIFCIDVSLKCVNDILRARVGLLNVEILNRNDMGDVARKRLFVDAIETVANAIVD